MPTVSATPPAPRSGSNSNWVFVAIVTGIILVALWAIRSILLLTFTAVILVIFFSIPIRRLQMLTFPGGRKIGRPTAIALTLLGVVFLLILLSLMVFPQVFQQFGSLFSTTIPQGIERLVEWWDNGRVLYNLSFLRNFDLTNLVEAPSPAARALGTIRAELLDVVLHIVVEFAVVRLRERLPYALVLEGILPVQEWLHAGDSWRCMNRS